MQRKRYTQRELPPYAFTPGRTPHPEKEGGHMFKEELNCMPLNPNTFHFNEDYLYAFDLFNFGYFWESHVWWEELWNHAGRKGEEADLLKALIKVAAAGVKLRLNHQQPSFDHIKRAVELLTPLAQSHPDQFYGLNLSQIIAQLKLIQKGKTIFDHFHFVLNNE